jgi:hypothetical protein
LLMWRAVVVTPSLCAPTMPCTLGGTIATGSAASAISLN